MDRVELTKDDKGVIVLVVEVIELFKGYKPDIVVIEVDKLLIITEDVVAKVVIMVVRLILLLLNVDNCVFAVGIGLISYPHGFFGDSSNNESNKYATNEPVVNPTLYDNVIILPEKYNHFLY